eukprot:Gb_39461 [translate_table: standard]
MMHCDILRKAAEAGGLLVDAMVNDQEEGVQKVSSVPPLTVVENGCGSPCIDFRQVSSELAAAAKDADLYLIMTCILLPDCQEEINSWILALSLLVPHTDDGWEASPEKGKQDDGYEPYLRIILLYLLLDGGIGGTLTMVLLLAW